MKKIILIIFITLLAGKMEFVKAQTPFNRGINLTGWFQTTSTHQIQFSKYTKKDFENIKSLGCDVIRLPINLFYMTDGTPDYTIDPLFFDFLDQAVTWAEDLQLYLILDNHSGDEIASKNPNLEMILTKVWSQMAIHYKDRSPYILFEIMNEPNGLTTQVWGGIQQKAITAIRDIDTQHTIVVGPSNWNSYTDLNLLPVYSDTNLVYTFHFYDPFVFTHQGATWPVPSMGSLANVPFPYNAATMPAVPADLANTWVAGALTNYMNDGTVTKVKSLLDMAVTFKTTRNVNVYCGEYGVYNLNSNNTDRTYWYGQVRTYLESKGIAWTTWDYQNGFGLFIKGSNQQFNSDINIPLLTALGLNVPPQHSYVLKPDSVGFNIYKDYISENITESSNTSGGSIDFYSTEKPNNDKYCIYWSGCNQYGTVGFDFSPDKDLSTLKAENYALSFIVRGNTPGTTFDVRFTDTKTGATDHPWRMNFTMDETTAKWDNKWHKVYIPLTNFIDGGSWDNGWYPPAGAFDWKAVDRFDIVAEQESLVGKSFWFDNIQVVNRDTALVYDTSTFTYVNTITIKDPVFTIYPNPFTTSATIKYSLSKNENVEINLYNLSGQKIKTLLNANQHAGNYSLNLNRDSYIPQGMYICRFSISKTISALKITVI
jgi:endoglucanase